MTTQEKTKQVHYKVVETCLFAPPVPCDYQITIMDAGKYIAENGRGDKLEGRVSRRQTLIQSS